MRYLPWAIYAKLSDGTPPPATLETVTSVSASISDYVRSALSYSRTFSSLSEISYGMRIRMAPLAAYVNSGYDKLSGCLRVDVFVKAADISASVSPLEGAVASAFENLVGSRPSVSSVEELALKPPATAAEANFMQFFKTQYLQQESPVFAVLVTLTLSPYRLEA